MATAELKGKNLKISWSKVKGAAGYEVYANYCGSQKVKKIADTRKTTYTLKQLNGKRLSSEKCYKIKVKAYKKVNGKKEYTDNSLTSHICTKTTGKYANAEKVKVKKSKYNLKVGKTKNIKASVILPKGKIQLKDTHTAKEHVRLGLLQ